MKMMNAINVANVVNVMNMVTALTIINVVSHEIAFLIESSLIVFTHSCKLIYSLT